MLAVIGFLVILCFSVAVCTRWKGWDGASSAAARQKTFFRPVAEGVRYRDCQNLGVDRFAFKSCHVEKRRNGAITFGAFNVLVVDELVLNLPVEASSVRGDASVESSLGWLKDNGLADALLRSQGLGRGRVSSLRINGLTVNRSGTNGVRFVFSAVKAESGTGKDGLRLRECVVCAPDGGKARVNEARLVLKPEPTLVYIKGGIEQRIEL